MDMVIEGHLRMLATTEYDFVFFCMVWFTYVGFIEWDFLFLLERNLPETSLSIPSVLCPDSVITALKIGNKR